MDDPPHQRRCRRPHRAHGPPSEHENRTGDGRLRPSRTTSEVQTMQTIKKLRDKIQHGSALNGWRMRWYMQ